jgi:hypothetical protein
MAKIQYLDIILSGYFSDESLLKKYLIRKQKELKRKNFVSKTEFIQRCQNIMILFENDIENQFTKKRIELYQIANLLKNEKKPFEKELELAKNLSKDNLYIKLSSLTNDKFKGELWHNQIEFIKKCIDEINNPKVNISIPIKDLDIENYLNFVFTHKSISRESKKNAILKLMEDRKLEKTFSNYRILIDYVFNQQNYWKEPTEEERTLFENWRRESLTEMMALFDNYSTGNPKPKVILEGEFEKAILDILSEETFQETFSDFMNRNLPKDLKKLAIVIGKLDFIKTFQKSELENQAKNQKEKTKIPEKWYALLYWLELKVSGEKPPINIEGNFIKSKLEEIGRKKCKSTGQSFYNYFKNIKINDHKSINAEFGKDWQEVIKKLSNDTKIIKYIDENY